MIPRVTLTVKGGALDGKQYVLWRPGTCLVGRGFDCQIILPPGEEFMSISRHHCRFEIDSPHVRVRDCGSRNGTWINGMQIGRPSAWHLPQEITSHPCNDYQVFDGDEIQIGPALVLQVEVKLVPAEVLEHFTQQLDLPTFCPQI